jgi:hypothetical protein
VLAASVADAPIAVTMKRRRSRLSHPWSSDIAWALSHCGARQCAPTIFACAIIAASKWPNARAHRKACLRRWKVYSRQELAGQRQYRIETRCHPPDKLSDSFCCALPGKPVKSITYCQFACPLLSQNFHPGSAWEASLLIHRFQRNQRNHYRQGHPSRSSQPDKWSTTTNRISDLRPCHCWGT